MAAIGEDRTAQVIEGFHAAALGGAAIALMLGLATGQAASVKAGVSLMLLLPPFRLATTIVGELRAKRLAVAAMGLLVLAFLLLSRLSS